MKNRDATEKDAKISTEPEGIATAKTDKTTAVGKELTDEECAAVVGGIQGQHIGANIAITKQTDVA
jgi:hypothetical protein